MKWMKIYWHIFLCFIVVLSLCACDDKNYPTEFKSSKAQSASDVLYPSFPMTTTFSDGQAAIVDLSNISSGYLGCKLLTNTNSGIKLIVEKEDKKYTYDIQSDTMMAFPLTCGNGSYSIRIVQNVEGTMYSILASTSIDVEMNDSRSPFLYPSQIVNYQADSKIVQVSMKVVKGDKNDLERIEHIYEYVLENLSYDEQEASTIDSFKIVDIDELLKTKKGICIDYAVLMASMCRIQGIPCRVVVGATDIEYHAWCEIYLKGKGWINPKVYFKSKKWSIVDPTFADSNQDYEGKYQEDYHY